MTGVDVESDPYAARPWLASYPPHAPAEIDAASYSTLTDMFRNSAAEYAARTAMESFGVKLTYAELEAAAVAVASWLQSRHLAKASASPSWRRTSWPIRSFCSASCSPAASWSTSTRYIRRASSSTRSTIPARAFSFVLENFAHTVQTAWPRMTLEAAVIVKPGDLLGLKGALVNVVSKWIKRAVGAFSLPGSVAFSSVLKLGGAGPSNRWRSDATTSRFCNIPAAPPASPRAPCCSTAMSPPMSRNRPPG